jgi:UDP:flavonoid glycosyltransferase YjiC (YdhE family)
MRILFSANPMFGHVNPLLPLAASATAAGHRVLFATGADLTEHVRRHGIGAAPVGPSYAEARTDREEPWIEFFARVAHDRARELVPLARRWEPDVVVHDETELAGAAVAAVSGCRHVVHGLGVPPPAHLWQVLTEAIHRLGTTWGAPGPPDLQAATYISPCPPTLEPDDSMPWARIRRIRPTIASPDGYAPAPRSARPDGPATVHVTLGTVFNDQPAKLREIIDAVARLPVEVIAATGPGVNPAALGALPANVRVHEYLPYDRLLPACSAVVSHGGAGVVLASLAHGIPQLLIPQGADQHGNAQACVRAGAALALDATRLSAGAIRTALTTVLDDPSFAAAAAVLRDEIAAMPDPSAVVADLTDEPARR